MATTTSNTSFNREIATLTKNLEQLRKEVNQSKNNTDLDDVKARLDRASVSVSKLTDGLNDQQREMTTFKKQVTNDLQKIIDGMRELARRVQ